MLQENNQRQDMRVTRTFGYDYAGRRNNMVLAHERINMQPNQLFAAGSDEAKQQTEDNADCRLFVETDQKAGDGQVPFIQIFAVIDIDQDGSTEDYIRIDDTHCWSRRRADLIAMASTVWLRLNQITAENFIRNDHVPTKTRHGWRRPTYCDLQCIELPNSPSAGDANQHGNNRGANTITEFEMQQEKNVNAILRLDAGHHRVWWNWEQRIW